MNTTIQSTVQTPKEMGKFKLFKKQWRLFVFMIPGLLVTLVFAYFPLAGVVIAFQDYSPMKGFFHSPFVGFKWFSQLFQSPDYAKVTIYTFIMSVAKLVIGFPAPIIFALMLNEIRAKRFKKFIQTLSYLPHFLSWIIVSIIVYRVVDPNDGIFTGFFSMFGISGLSIMGNSNYFIPVAVISDIWKEIGFSAIFYLAALTAIDPSLYEAAKVDGANKLKQIIHITLPGIMPTAVILMILTVGGLVNANFDQVYNLQNPYILSDTEVINTFIYRRAIFFGEYSISTAFGLAQGIVALILVLATNAFGKKIANTSIY